MTNTELMEKLREAKTMPEAVALMRQFDQYYRARHAVEIKTIIAALAK